MKLISSRRILFAGLLLALTALMLLGCGVTGTSNPFPRSQSASTVR